MRLALDPPTPGSQRLERAATKQPDGACMLSEIALAELGIWTVRVIVTPDGGKPISLDAPIRPSSVDVTDTGDSLRTIG